MSLRSFLVLGALLSAPCWARGDEPCAGAAAFCKLTSHLDWARRRNAEQYAIPKGGIDEGRYVTLGGIEQWITIRGWDRNNPVLLFVHGGPGDVTNPWAYAIFAPWEKQFTVVQWDQRGAGRTLRKTGPGIAPTLTIARLVDDGVALAEQLHTTLGRKIVVVGHSFGSIIALGMVGARPDLFAAYVGTGQVGDARENYRVAWQALTARARALGDTQALAELSSVGPPPYADGRGYGVQRKWANIFEGADRFLPGMLGFALMAPGYSVDDVTDWDAGQLLAGERLVPQGSRVGPKELGLDFKLPIFVIQGSDDFTTPTSLARAWLDAVAAPKKELVTIEGAGHFAVFMKPDRFLDELVRRVRPLAMKP